MFNTQLDITELKISKLEVTAVGSFQNLKKKKKEKEKRRKPLNINLKKTDIRKNTYIFAALSELLITINFYLKKGKTENG